jgi:hypothetical protein
MMFLSFGLTLLIALWFGQITCGLAAGVQIMGQLANFDVRYPPSLPNDLEIVVYGAGLKTNDVAGTWNSNTLLGGNGVQWGTASSITGGVNNDTASPAFGLDFVSARYSGPARPAMVGQLCHFGVRLRIGAAVAHQEVWWTINGQRILRPDAPQIIWTCVTNGWLIGVANPTTQPIYVYGCRYFPVTNSVPLPLLSQLEKNINPVSFGATNWTALNLPGNQRVFTIPALTRIYLRVPSVNWRPIVFQIASRDVSESVLPLSGNAQAPNPNDWNGSNGTTVILTTRPTQEFAEDINNDGAVGIPDFNQLRTSFGATSEDRTQTQ